MTSGGVSTTGGVVLSFGTGTGQSYPLCLPLLSFLQSPNVEFTGLCAPVAAELTPTTGEPTSRHELARRDRKTRFAETRPAFERCVIIRGLLVSTRESTIWRAGSWAISPRGETPGFASPPHGRFALIDQLSGGLIGAPGPAALPAPRPLGTSFTVP